MPASSYCLVSFTRAGGLTPELHLAPKLGGRHLNYSHFSPLMLRPENLTNTYARRLYTRGIPIWEVPTSKRTRRTEGPTDWCESLWMVQPATPTSPYCVQLRELSQA